jgi:hypothetical protein
MGEVYKARDTRLDRSVAIKLLPAEFAADATFRVRFDREAKALSALNHPSICSIYDVGPDYLVLEHCEGKTLAARLATGPLVFNDVLQYGIQIAEALDKAHCHRVIHRDLKPSNIIVTSAGVKLLDFGLAKQQPEWSPEEATEQRVTREGHVLGTVQYMAPELFHGKEADVRSDIFALGLVLFEMAVGKPAFTGISKAGLIASILEHEPASIAVLKPEIPPSFDLLVRSCLAKSPDDRIQSAHDVALQLRWLREGAGFTTSRRTSRVRAIVLAAATSIALAAVATLWIAKRFVAKTSAPPAPTIRTTIDLRGAPPLALALLAPKYGMYSTAVALSHDGTTVVYAGVANEEVQLFRRRLDSPAIEPIQGTRGAYSAFFSPDDKWSGFLTADKVMKVPAAGGSPIAVAAASAPLTGMWGRDGIISFSEQGRLLMRVPADGGPIRRFEEVRCTSVLPAGRTLLCTEGDRASGDYQTIVTYDVQTKVKTPLISRGYSPVYVPLGFILFARAGDLYAIRFDAVSHKLTGEPSILQTGVAMDSFSWRAQYSASDDGTIVYVPGGDRSLGGPVLINRKGESNALKLPTHLYRSFELSPDGRRIASEVDEITDSIWISDVVSGSERKLPVAGRNVKPLWTGDGRSVIFGSARSGDAISDIVQMDVETNSMLTLYAERSATLLPSSLSNDGQALIVMKRSTEGKSEAIVFRPAEHLSQQRLPMSDTTGVHVSPDGRYVAWSGNRSGTYELWVAPMDRPEQSWQVSSDGGYEPKWCRTCDELFFRKGTEWYSSKVSTGDTFRFELPVRVWKTDFIDTPGVSYDVSSDGSKLLVMKSARPHVNDRIELVQNWPALLRQASLP